MSCGPDCECSSLPEAHVVAVSVRGRVGYGVSWGADGSRNEGRQIYPDEGCTCPAAGVLTGVLRILEDAEKRNEMKVLITISICTLVDVLTESINQLPANCCQHLFRRIAECKVKGVYRKPCCYSKKGFQRAIFQARLITGTHSLSPNPINDNLFKNGVIGVAIYGEYKMTASGEMKGAYACYFEEGFTDSLKQEMNKCEWVPQAKHEVVPFLVGLEETFSLLLHEQYRQVRIKTSSHHVVRWFDHMKNDQDEDLTKTPLSLLYFFYKLFRKVEIEYDPQDETAGVLEAKRMVDKLFESTVDGLYWKDGVPVVYTDGSVQGEGTRAAAGGGVFRGPDDPRNRTCQIIGPQTSSSGEFGAVVKALETAIQKEGDPSTGHSHRFATRHRRCDCPLGTLERERMAEEI